MSYVPSKAYTARNDRIAHELGPVERSSKPLRRPSLWPFAIALALFALAVVRW